MLPNMHELHDLPFEIQAAMIQGITKEIADKGEPFWVVVRDVEIVGMKYQHLCLMYTEMATIWRLAVKDECGCVAIIDQPAPSAPLLGPTFTNALVKKLLTRNGFGFVEAIDGNHEAWNRPDGDPDDGEWLTEGMENLEDGEE
jgi:hypothetical protein